jgi:hypothetical protein
MRSSSTRILITLERDTSEGTAETFAGIEFGASAVAVE